MLENTASKKVPNTMLNPVLRTMMMECYDATETEIDSIEMALAIIARDREARHPTQSCSVDTNKLCRFPAI